MDQHIFKLQEDLNEKLNLVVEDYYVQVQQTEKYWNRDNNMALKIQSIFKMHRLMKIYCRKRFAAIKFQTKYRGHLARKKFKDLREKQINMRNIFYFSNQAIVIQKHFRGFHKRKYVHDFFARKQFLNLLQQRNENFLIDLNRKAEEEKIEEERRQEAIARQEFNSLAKNLHHLSSTYTTPGVYNPPFAQQKPTAFNIDVETHLKATFKANYKWKPPNKDDLQHFSVKPQFTKRPQLAPINSQKKKDDSENQKQNQNSFKNINISNQQSQNQQAQQNSIHPQQINQ